MVLTDPPYSSDEFNGSARFQSFTGDNMDQRALTMFLREVFMAIRPTVKERGDPGAPS